MDKIILHCDLNNFYASVEQKFHPEAIGVPMAVCGDPKMRHGIILSKNELAKAAGVKTAETVWSAKKKCPGLLLLKPHYEEYIRYSKQVFSIYTQYTDRVESFGIDECWLDVTQSAKLFGDGKAIADKLREEIKEQTGLTVSVGVSFTKTLSKLGSDLKKPDATTVLTRADYMDVIGELPVTELIMIGPKTAAKLKDFNIRTIRQLYFADVKMLREKFGAVGNSMINAARGIETEEIKRFYEVRIPKSVSNGTTAPRDIVNAEEAKTVVYALCERIAMRLRKHNLAAAGIAVTLKTADFRYFTRQKPLPNVSASASYIAENAVKLLLSMHSFPAPLRSVTVSAIRLTDRGAIQLSFFDEELDKEEKLEKSIDKIRSKYGYHSVKRGLVLNTELSANLHDEDGFVPFKNSDLPLESE